MTNNTIVLSNGERCISCKSTELELEPAKDKWQQEEKIRCKECGLVYKRLIEPLTS